MTSKLQASLSKLQKRGQTFTQQFSGRLGQSKGRLLVLESRGFGIKAYLLERQGETVDLTAFVQNKIIPIAQSLTDIVSQLKAQKHSVPKQCILVSGACTSALLSLPIDGDNSLPDEQMQELVRWELEPLFNEHIAHWTIGGLLIARGYLTEPQRKELLQQLGEQKERLAGRGGRAPARFGELAVRAEFITLEQLEECLSIHEEIQLIDPALDCSWSQAAVNSKKQDGLWLCSAMSRPIREQWLNACEQSKLTLKGIYSQHHSAVVQLPETSKSQIIVVINVSLVTVMVVNDAQVTLCKQHRCSDYALTCEDVLSLVEPVLSEQHETIYYSGHHPNITQFIEALHAQTARQCDSLDGVWDISVDEVDSLSGDAAIMGAARHFFLRKSNQLLSCIAGTPPPPPWYQQPVLQGAAVVSLLLSGAAANEGFHYYHLHQSDLEIVENEVAIEKIDSVNSKLSKEDAKYGQLMKDKEALELKLEVLAARSAGLNQVLLSRQEFVKSLLPLLASSVNDLMIIDNVTEQSWYQFKISGWAAEQLAVDNFYQALTTELEHWQMEVTENESAEGPSEQGYPGYRFDMTFTQVALLDEK